MSEAVTNAADPAAAAPVVPAVEAQDVEQIDKAPAEKANFTDAELREFKAKHNTPKQADPAPAKPAEEAKVDETKPKSEPASDKPKHQPKPDAEARIQKLTRELNEAKSKLAAKETPSPKTEPAPVKPVEAKPDPKPKMADFEDIEKWEEAKDAWYEREADRRADAAVQKALADRDTKHASDKAKTEAEQFSQRQETIRAKLNEEFGDWDDVVLGTDEAEGIGSIVSKPVANWANQKGEVAFRGLYALAKLPEAKRAEILAMDADEQVAEIITLGKGKKSIAAPAPVTSVTKRPGPPTKEVSTGAAPAVDPMKAIISGETLSDDQIRAFKQMRNAQDQKR